MSHSLLLAIALFANSALGLPSDPSLPDCVSTSDWTSIRAAYETGRHAVFTVEDGFQARNPGQQWTAIFDGRGFSVTPDAGDWSWGLDLERYGWGAEKLDVSIPLAVTSAGQRIEYTWDNQLTEWYVNDQRGLEHGFTVLTRPADAHGTLTLELSVRGGLAAVVRQGRRGLRFIESCGGATLNYSGLTVLDADGRTLDAHFELAAAGLRLQIEDAKATYPLTIDPIAQQAYLKASNPDGLDNFGFSVSIFGDTVVVGAPFEDSSATGVNGNQSNDSADGAGAAYVFVRSGTTWSQQAYLKASNTAAGDRFGISVSISGDTVVVGAREEASNAIGANGNQADNSAPFSGAAYIFVRSGTTWSQQAYLKASNTEAYDRFGSSVSISGNTVVVGALNEASNAIGVDGNQADNSATSSGAAYVFARSGTSWTQQAYLKASNTDLHDTFGLSVSVSGDRVAVGATGEGSRATGVNGNQSDNSASHSGAVYVFVRSGIVWSQQAYVKASNTDTSALFGFSVSVCSDTLVVGSRAESSNATGVNGNQADNSATLSGAAYVFVQSGTSWSQQAYLKASNTEAGDMFGQSVSVSNNTIVVGALYEDSSATGANGNQVNNSTDGAGAAFVFVRNGVTWSQQAYVKASNTDILDMFGVSVSVSGDTIVVGASGEGSSAAGVDGDQSDNSIQWAGASYVILVSANNTGSAYCFGDSTGAVCPCSAFGAIGEGCGNSGGLGGAMLVGLGNGSINDDTFQLHALGVPGDKPGLILRGSSQVLGGTGMPVGDGLLCTNGQSARSQVQLTNAGSTLFSDFQGSPFGLSSFGAGVPTNYQFWYRDPQNTCTGAGFNFSNAWTVTWLP